MRYWCFGGVMKIKWNNTSIRQGVQSLSMPDMLSYLQQCKAAERLRRHMNALWS